MFVTLMFLGAVVVGLAVTRAVSQSREQRHMQWTLDRAFARYRTAGASPSDEG